MAREERKNRNKAKIEVNREEPIRSLHTPMTHWFLPSSPRRNWNHPTQSLLRRLYPPARALHSALPTTPSPTPLFQRRTRRKARATRRVDLHERLRPRDVPAEEADCGRSEERRSERGALSHLGAHDLEPAHVREHLHREVPVRHAPVHLEVRELRLGVELHALDHRVRLERVCLERRACDVCRCGVRRQAD